MNIFGLTTDQVMARIHKNGASVSIPSLGLSILIGSLGFCFVSLCVFATVAFDEIWMYRNLGIGGSYLLWTALFILLGGGLLSPLVIGPGRLRRFLLLFGTAFLFYAVGWTGSYFTLHGLSGEWAGSFAGSLLMALIITFAFGVINKFFTHLIVLFIANSAGYFIGRAIHHSSNGKMGFLLWGIFYGLCLGAGLGLSLFLAQTNLRSQLAKLKPHLTP